MQESMEKTTAMIEHFAEVNRILKKHNYSASKLIPILQETQDVYKCLSNNAETGYEQVDILACCLVEELVVNVKNGLVRIF